MKNLFILSFVLLALPSFAQDAISTYFSDYNDEERFTKVSISGKMFELMTHIEGETQEEREMLEAIADLTGMKMLVCAECGDATKMYAGALKRLGSEFEELLRVEDNEEDLTFLIKESGGRVAELFLVARSEGEFFIMSLVGDIDLNQIAQIGRAVNVEGLEKLEKMDDK